VKINKEYKNKADGAKTFDIMTIV